MSDDNSIRAGYALPGAGMPIDAPSYDYTALLGRSATLKPCGENVVFEVALPRRGTLTQQLALTDWASDWLVLMFDEPFHYDNAVVRYCLIRARWNGCPVGSEFCPVFVLTDNRGALSTKNRWSSEDFQFISWAVVEVDES